MALRGNIGEWSEIYVLLRLLADGHLSVTGSDTPPSHSSSVVVTDVVRRHETFELHYELKDSTVLLHVVPDASIARFDRAALRDAADEVLRAIQARKKLVKGPLEIPALEPLLDALQVSELKLSGTTKSDIDLVIWDAATGSRLDASYSIKSLLGARPSLLNASSATNFTYAVVADRPLRPLKELAAVGTPRLIGDLTAAGYHLEFQCLDNTTFAENLRLIDGQLPVILGCLLRCHFEGAGTTLLELLEAVTDEDPCGFGATGALQYKYKIRALLESVALGMKPATPWSGRLEATGGYLVVTSTGELICLPSTRIDDFKDYLLKATKLERGGRKRHKYGFLDLHGDVPTLKLNLQIRFR